MMATDEPTDMRRRARDKRALHVANALGALRIEGVEVDAQTRAIMERYVDGNITVYQATAQVLKHWRERSSD